MMKMLQATGIEPLTDNQRQADEDNPKGYYEYERVKKLKDGDTAWLPLVGNKAVKVISALLQHLPPEYDYRVIFMQRELSEILASQRRMLENRGENPDAVSDEQMADLFVRHLQQVNAWLASQPNIQRVEVNYNQLLRDPFPYLAQVNNLLGGNLDTEKMAAIIDPDLYRQRS
jgi:argonaute-like protein implicated in RNA metabolism and viral defense